MNNKDLFNAIDKAADDFQFEMREQIEGERPVILRAEKRSAKKTVRGIMLGVGGAAAAAALCVCVVSGVKGGLNTASASGSETDEDKISYITDKFDERNIFRVRDMGLYRSKWSYEALKNFEKTYREPMTRADFGMLIYSNSGIFIDMGVPLHADVYFYNDIAIDSRMLSNEAFDWFRDYGILTEEENAANEMPDYVKFLTGKGLVRYGDLGFLEERYTETELERIKAYCATPLLYSSLPPEPDVYYYNDIAYNLDQVGSEDAKNWLKWYCWLDEKTQEELSGYVPEELTGTVTICNSEKPAELVTYKGKSFDVRSVSYDTEKYIKWYNSLPGELQDKVGFVPGELDPELIKDYPGVELPVEIIGADGEKLTYDDLADAIIYKYSEEGTKGGAEEEIGLGDIEEWQHLVIRDMVYLQDPETGKFRKYHVGDVINGLTITDAQAAFDASCEGAIKYSCGSVWFKGEITVDAAAEDPTNHDTGYWCGVSGLPVIALDGEKADGGQAVGVVYGVGDKHGTLEGENDRLFNSRGGEVKNVKIKDLRMRWDRDAMPSERYGFTAELCYEAGASSAADWANGITTLPVKEFDDIITVNWTPNDTENLWDYDANDWGWSLDMMKTCGAFLRQQKFLTKYGAEVYSVADGEIVETGYRENDYGNYVAVKYGEHIYVTYGHLSDISVNVGDKVSAGQLIGHTGKSGWYAQDSLITGGVVDYHFSAGIDWLHAPIETGVPGFKIPET